MSDGVKISALPAADSPTDSDVFPVVQGGVTKRIALSAASVPYGSGTVASALDTLLYVPPSATFSLSVGTVEIGSTVLSVTATWSFNKTMVSTTLTDTTITPTDTTRTFPDLSLTSNKTYVLGFSDGSNSGSISRAVTFSPKRYWGVHANTTLVDSDIIAMSQEFSASKSKSISYDCSGGKYFYLCYPSSSGLPANATVGGLAFSDYTVSTQGFTNASGYTQNYNVVRCNNIQTGSAINVVWA